MVIAFANQKGGVGKSTLCLSLANYWASQGLPVHVVDTDLQKSLVKIREDELKQYPQRVPLFDIEANLLNGFMTEVSARRKDARHHLIDLPGTYEKGIVEVVKYSDAVIVPFQYEESVLNTTSMFGTYLDIIDARHKEIDRKIIYVPNSVNFSVGRKEDIEYWNAWKKAIEEAALLSPPIPHRVCMQRRSSIFLTNEERACVEACFDYITSIVFEKQLNKEKQDKQ